MGSIIRSLNFIGIKKDIFNFIIRIKVFEVVDL